MERTKDESRDENLRRKALEALKAKTGEPAVPSSEAETLKLVHELQVHQIELELQNEELVNARAAALEAADKYTALYDFAPSGYMTLSEKGRILEINLHGAALLGEPRASAIDSIFDNYLGLESREVFDSFFTLAFQGTAMQSCQIVIHTPDAQEKQVDMRGIVVGDDRVCLITMTDISTLKQIERDLVAAKEQAEESNRLKSAFLANMSHEIRTPMNGIMGFTWLLKEPMITAEQKAEYLEVIEKSGTRMLNVINDIINISKVETGLMETWFEVTNLNEQIAFIEKFFKPQIEAKRLQFIVPKGLIGDAVFLETDKEKLYSILTNLVKNAIKFTATGSIELGCTKREDCFEFFVRDTGIGFGAEQGEIIFDRFRQGSDASPRKFEGSGLGLTISKAYVEMMGGTIWAESVEGKGSTFYFTLPFTPPNQVQRKLRTGSAEPQSTQTLKPLRILIAEDDDISEKVLIHAVKPFSRDILTVNSGTAAVEICLENPDIDLVLMDVRMLEMDGYEATRRIRQNRNQVVIIAQTALALADERDAAIEAGCDDYISKPIDREALIKMIHHHFDAAEVPQVNE